MYVRSNVWGPGLVIALFVGTILYRDEALRAVRRSGRESVGHTVY